MIHLAVRVLSSHQIAKAAHALPRAKHSIGAAPSSYLVRRSICVFLKGAVIAARMPPSSRPPRCNLICREENCPHTPSTGKPSRSTPRSSPPSRPPSIAILHHPHTLPRRLACRSGRDARQHAIWRDRAPTVITPAMDARHRCSTG